MTNTPENTKYTRGFDYRIHVVVSDGRNEKIGSSIGVAFNNKSGNGFTAYLDAVPIPVDGKIKIVGLIPDQS